MVAVVEAGKGTVVVEVGTGRGLDALATILSRLESARDPAGRASEKLAGKLTRSRRDVRGWQLTCAGVWRVTVWRTVYSRALM